MGQGLFVGQGDMGELIHFPERNQRPTEVLVCVKPWEFRKGLWQTAYFTQMTRSQSEKMEKERGDHGQVEAISQIPPHFVLKGGIAFTIRALYSYRYQEEKMRDVYYLFGLMDCMMFRINPLLRTDLLRSLYKKVFSLKRTLDVRWYGHLDQVLLPIHSEFYNESEYRSAVAQARTMKGLYEVIRGGTDEMFDILGLEYVFYCPGIGRS